MFWGDIMITKTEWNEARNSMQNGGEIMKAITLWQPWASLIACGAKKYETRGWATNYHGPIAIHAALKDARTMFDELPLDVQTAMSPFLVEHYSLWSKVPHGAVIATTELVECWEIRDATSSYGTGYGYKCIGIGDNARIISPNNNELLFGDWTSGRYAWELANVQMLPEPIPAKGRQGLWNWEE